MLDCLLLRHQIQCRLCGHIFYHSYHHSIPFDSRLFSVTSPANIIITAEPLVRDFSGIDIAIGIKFIESWHYAANQCELCEIVL